MQQVEERNYLLNIMYKLNVLSRMLSTFEVVLVCTYSA